MTLEHTIQACCRVFKGGLVYNDFPSVHVQSTYKAHYCKCTVIVYFLRAQFTLILRTCFYCVFACSGNQSKGEFIQTPSNSPLRTGLLYRVLFSKLLQGIREKGMLALL